ncbi:MAG: hypothetical protein QMD65_01715 [Patescibacteria group bacterium]|nr:hypothetical protein [Patescibacteria group bacterium]
MNIKKNRSIITWIAVIVAIIALLFLMQYINPEKQAKKRMAEVGIECINVDDSELKQHFHPKFSINVDGKNEPIPADIGVFQDCSAEIHTHDSTGELHIETTNPDKKFTLGQFFAIWGRSIMRNRYNVVVSVNGNGFMENEDFYNKIELKDGEQIVIDYR